jgi:hypothetical protein
MTNEQYEKLLEITTRCDERINMVLKRQDAQPCQKHGEDISELKAKAGIIGAISGAVMGFCVNMFTGK